PLDLARIQGAPLLRHEQAAKAPVRDAESPVEAEHLRFVFRYAGGDLLVVAIAHAGLSLHDDSRLRAVHPGPPRAFRADDVAGRIELRRVFPEVPDVTLAVLSVVVGRSFNEHAVFVCVISNDGANDAQDVLLAKGDVR